MNLSATVEDFMQVWVGGEEDLLGISIHYSGYMSEVQFVMEYS